MKTSAEFFVSFIAIGFLFFFASYVHADEFTVPDDVGCGSIQGCISQAFDGDIITVKPDTYVENIDFLGKAVTVRSQDGPETTVIDGNDADAVVTFSSGEGSGSVLEGFTVTNAGHLGGGTSPIFYVVYCQDASPVIQGNIITNIENEEGALVVGIHVDGGAPVITGNRVVENMVGAYASGGAYGIRINQVEGSPAAVVSENELIYNGAGCQHPMGFCTGAGIVFGGESVVIRNNILAGNGGSGGYGSGYGVHLSGNDIVFVHNTVVASIGYGVMIEADSSATVLNNIVAYHFGHSLSFGLCVMGDGSLTEDYNNLWENEGDYCGPPGPHDLALDPLFVDLSGFDFHLQKGSLCIDRGTDAGVIVDIDGDSRPQGPGFDLGADEVPPEPWGAATEAMASVYGNRISTHSNIANPLYMVFLPAAVVVLLRILRRKK